MEGGGGATYVNMVVLETGRRERRNFNKKLANYLQHLSLFHDNT